MTEYTDCLLAKLVEYLRTHPEVRPFLSDAWYLGLRYAQRNPDADSEADPFLHPGLPPESASV